MARCTVSRSVSMTSRGLVTVEYERVAGGAGEPLPTALVPERWRTMTAHRHAGSTALDPEDVVSRARPDRFGGLFYPVPPQDLARRRIGRHHALGSRAVRLEHA